MALGFVRKSDKGELSICRHGDMSALLYKSALLFVFGPVLWKWINGEDSTDTNRESMEIAPANSDSNSEKRPISMNSTSVPIYDGHYIDHKKQRYPYCVVWTPIPCLTWFMPFIGHMGIATSQGVIRDFAGPYFVSEDDMGFGRPTKYWQMNPKRVRNSKGTPKDIWDKSVYDASEEYKTRMHNLCCDNCHSHVAMALNLMEYEGSRSWNMVKLCFLMLIHGKYVSACGFIKTWLPFLIMAGIIVGVVLALRV